MSATRADAQTKLTWALAGLLEEAGQTADLPRLYAQCDLSRAIPGQLRALIAALKQVQAASAPRTGS